MKTKAVSVGITNTLLFLVPLLSLVILAYMGIFSRYMSDDYHTAYNLNARGLWGMFSYYWELWTGRYSFLALLGIVELLGPKVVPVLPGLMIVLSYAAVSWMSFQILKSMEMDKPVLISLCLGGLITWISIRSLFLYPEILFWQTGIINYSVSPLLVALGVGLLLRRLRSQVPITIGEMLVVSLLAFLGGGFSEGAVAVQITLPVLALLVAAVKPTRNRRQIVSLAGAVLSGSLMSLIVMALSPGNLARAIYPLNNEFGSSYDADNIQNIGGWILRTNTGSRILDALSFTWFTIMNWIANRTVLASLAFCTGLYLGLIHVIPGIRLDTKVIFRSLVTAGVFAYLIILAAITPSFAARGIAPPERALLLPMFFLVSFVIYSGWCFGGIFSGISSGRLVSWIQTGVAGLAILCLLAGPLATLVSNIRTIPVLKSYAAIWDERDRLIRLHVSSGGRTIVVASIQKAKELSKLQPDSIWKVGDIDEDPDYWVNRAAAQYYGLEEISTR